MTPSSPVCVLEAALRAVFTPYQVHTIDDHPQTWVTIAVRPGTMPGTYPHLPWDVLADGSVRLPVGYADFTRLQAATVAVALNEAHTRALLLMAGPLSNVYALAQLLERADVGLTAASAHTAAVLVCDHFDVPSYGTRDGGPLVVAMVCEALRTDLGPAAWLTDAVRAALALD